MQDDRFDAITKLAASTSRRSILRALAGGAIGAALGLAGLEHTAAQRPRRKKKRRNGHQTAPGTDAEVQGGDAVECSCVTYLRLGLGLVPCCSGDAEDYGPLLLSNGFRQVNQPVADSIMVLQHDVWGAVSDTDSGHIAWVKSAQRASNGTWNITVQHANWSEGKVIAGAGPCAQARLTPMNRAWPAAGVAFYKRTTQQQSTRLQIEAAVHDPANNQSIFAPVGKVPLHPTIAAEVQLTSAGNQVFTQVGQVTYNAQKDAYVGTVDFGTGIAGGAYIVRVKFRDYVRTLRKQAGNIVTIQQGTTNVIPRVVLTPGDANDDNAISNADYQMIVDCYGANPPACTPDKKKGADINDDGVVNEFDYNLFLRVMGNSGGASATSALPASIEEAARKRR